MLDILIKPLVTEKMKLQSDKVQQLWIQGRQKGKKHQIKKAIERIYDVTVNL